MSSLHVSGDVEALRHSDLGAETSLSVPYTATLSALHALSSGALRRKKSLEELSIPGTTMSDFMNTLPSAHH